MPCAAGYAPTHQMYAQQLLLPWAEAVLEHAGRPPLFDAHVHVGLHDPAAYLVTPDEALAALGQVGSRALVFALKEPRGYREANDRMLALAAEHPGRLRALARLDPAADALGEAQRCLGAGAAGFKLHPRSEGFALDDHRLDDVFALAGERRLPVMLHAGVGDDAVGMHAVARAQANPGARLILAHCAVGAHEQVITRHGEVPNLLFDPSWWNPAELWSLFRRVPPGRILHASDIPFASPGLAVVMTGRLGVEAGWTPEQLRGVLGEQLDRVVAGEELADLGLPQEPPQPLPPQLERVYVTLCAVVERMLGGGDPGQGLELARTACRDPSGPYAEILRHVATLLDLAGAAEPDPLRNERTPGWDLVLAAAVVARTPNAPSPAL